MTPIFKDSYGNEVCAGDTIIIEAHYKFKHITGKKYTVIWDERKGMYKYQITEMIKRKPCTSESDFFGVVRFKKVE